MRWLLRSRRRVLLLTIGLLLLLDGVPSIHARVVYAHPMESWQPDRAAYTDLIWPPGADVPQDAPLGQRFYAQQCAR